MLQIILAIAIILFFITKLIKEYRKQEISKTEFIVWIIFWIIGLIAVLMIKKIDLLLAKLGFSGTAINVIFYLAVIVLFHISIKQRVRIYKIEKEISKIVRHIAIKNL